MGASPLLRRSTSDSLSEVLRRSNGEATGCPQWSSPAKRAPGGRASPRALIPGHSKAVWAREDTRPPAKRGLGNSLRGRQQSSLGAWGRDAGADHLWNIDPAVNIASRRFCRPSARRTGNNSHSSFSVAGGAFVPRPFCSCSSSLWTSRFFSTAYMSLVTALRWARASVRRSAWSFSRAKWR